MAIETPTKAAFRAYLNAREDLNRTPDRRGGLTGARTRAYGDWLYSADKGMFDHLYAYYCEHGTTEGM